MPWTRLRAEEGEYTLELALIVVFLVSLLFAAIQLGLVQYTKQALSHAARQGAIAGGLTGRADAAAGETRKEAARIPFIEDVWVDVALNGQKRGDLLQVNVSAKLPLLFKIPVLSEWMDSSRLHGHGSYIYEKPS